VDRVLTEFGPPEARFRVPPPHLRKSRQTARNQRADVVCIHMKLTVQTFLTLDGVMGALGDLRRSQ
jgi:hypothetical protein